MGLALRLESRFFDVFVEVELFIALFVFFVHGVSLFVSASLMFMEPFFGGLVGGEFLEKAFYHSYAGFMF